MEKSKSISTILSWLFLVLVLATAVLISIFEELNVCFLALLIVNLVITILFAIRFNKQIIIVSRILAGLLFIYSGFVKGVDPVGTKYIVKDYFMGSPISSNLRLYLKYCCRCVGRFFFSVRTCFHVSLSRRVTVLFFRVS